MRYINKNGSSFEIDEFLFFLIVFGTLYTIVKIVEIIWK